MGVLLVLDPFALNLKVLILLNLFLLSPPEATFCGDILMSNQLLAVSAAPAARQARTTRSGPISQFKTKVSTAEGADVHRHTQTTQNRLLPHIQGIGQAT